MTFKFRPLTLLVLLLCFTGMASAQVTKYVTDGSSACPGADFADIQSAIDVTNPTGGDTVIVCPGLYEGQVVINHPVILKAEIMADSGFPGDETVNAVISGGSDNPPLYLLRINSRDVTVDGLDLVNSNYNFNDPGPVPLIDPSLILVGVYDSSHVDNVHITNNLLHNACNPNIPNTNSAQGVNWNNASGSIEGNAFFGILTGDMKGRGIWLSTNSASDPETILSQDVVVQNNVFLLLQSYAIGAARMNGVDIIDNDMLTSTGTYGMWFKLSSNFRIMGNDLNGYSNTGIVITQDNPGGVVSTNFMIEGNLFQNKTSNSAALALVPADRILFTGNTIDNLGSDANSSIAAYLGFDIPGYASYIANDNFLCDNFDLEAGMIPIAPGEFAFNPGGLNNAFPGGEAFAGNRGCVVDAVIDVRPGSTTNQINTRAKQLVPIAILTDGDFDACSVDPDLVYVRGALPTRSECKDVDDDGDLDNLLYFRARSFTQKPTTAECDDPDATVELTGITFEGTPVVGSDRVSWLGPDCK